MEHRGGRSHVPRRLAQGEFLREFEPDFFFDDQTGHIRHAALHVPSGHVASGISN
ncbi:MAG: 5'-nucleotidase [Burkholderiaceae bacterium]